MDKSCKLVIDSAAKPAIHFEALMNGSEVEELI
jgi:hypothetical protein